MVSLKGRSAWLKDYTDDVCNRILAIPAIAGSGYSEKEMKIYCSGGKFYLQVPDNEIVRKEIDKVRTDAEKELWEKHKGQLAINIAYVSFCYEGESVCVNGEKGNIGILWRHVTERFNMLKNQKFKHLLTESYDDFFEVKEVGGNARVCEVTGVEGAKERKPIFKDKEELKEETLCVLDSVWEQIEIGKRLRNKEGFKMLEDYAGNTYLGIMRMDVDGLGKRFAEGFRTMDEYCTFSNTLDYFFDAEKGKLRELYMNNDYYEYLNIVYAGGDDIFVVGRWDKTIDFAETIHNAFETFCSKELKDSSLSISGGVAILNPKFPIAKAAEMAGDAEDAAKKYRTEKNAFNMFGESLSWEKEFVYVKSYKNQFVKLIQENGLSHGILLKIMTYANMVKENQEIERGNSKRNRMPNLSYFWHTAYYLTRYLGKQNHDSAVKNFCKDLRDRQLHSPEQFRLMSIAARWAELELRINNSNK